MMELIRAMFSEEAQVSSMRVMSFLSLLAGVGIAFYSFTSGCKVTEATTMVAIFVGAAFGGKVWQKYAEIPLTIKNKKRK